MLTAAIACLTLLFVLSVILATRPLWDPQPPEEPRIDPQPGVRILGPMHPFDQDRSSMSLGPGRAFTGGYKNEVRPMGTQTSDG